MRKANRAEHLPQKRGGFLDAIKKHWQLYLLLLPPFLTVLIIEYIPFFGIQIAFKEFNGKAGIWGSKWVGLKYFIQFFKYPKFWNIIWNTLHINLLCLITFPLPVILAIMLNDIKDGVLKRTSQMVILAPHFVSVVIVCSMTILFLNRETGVVNRIIEAFGGTAEDWMAKSKMVAPIFAITEVWQNLGWDAIIYTAALSGINLELIDAAKVDGANKLHIVWHIYLPQLIPTMVVLFLLKIGGMMSVGFDKIFLFQNSLNMDASQVLSTYVYNVGIINGQMGYSTAVNLFSSVINLILICIFNFISKKTTEESLW